MKTLNQLSPKFIELQDGQDRIEVSIVSHGISIVRFTKTSQGIVLEHPATATWDKLIPAIEGQTLLF